jgi:ABC-type amino acid transport substrate-binding protein
MRRLLLAAMPLLAASGAAMAGKPALRQLRAVTLGVAPYGIRGKDGSSRGLFSDLLQLLAQRSGLAISNTVVPYPRAMAMMASGEADLLIAINNTTLDKIAAPLALAFKSEVVAVGRAGSRYASLADLRGKTVAHIRSAEYNAEFEHDALIRKYETSSIDQTLRMLLEGRVDAAVGFRDSLLYTLREMGLARERLGAPLPMGERSVWIHLSRRVQDAEIATTLLQAMDGLRHNGAVDELLKQYFGQLDK